MRAVAQEEPLYHYFAPAGSAYASPEELGIRTERMTVTVDHRPNRVVLFNSNLFHKSDEFDFGPGNEYTMRRINFTWLFGDRGECPSERR